MSAWSGLVAGFLHTLAGPDHFAVKILCVILDHLCEI